MPEYRNDEEGNFVCSFSGRLDTNAATSFEEELFDRVQKSKEKIVLDLKNTEYISSAFLRICVRIAARASKEKIRIINLSDTNFNVYKMTGLDRVFELHRI